MLRWYWALSCTFCRAAIFKKSNNIPHTTLLWKLLLLQRDLSEGLFLLVRAFVMVVMLLSPHTQRRRKEPGGRQWRRRNESRSSWVILPAWLLSALPIRPLRVRVFVRACVFRCAQLPSWVLFKAFSAPLLPDICLVSLPAAQPLLIPLSLKCMMPLPSIPSSTREKSPFCSVRCTRARTDCLNLSPAHSQAVGHHCCHTHEFLCICACKCASYMHKHVFVVWIFFPE